MIEDSDGGAQYRIQEYESHRDLLEVLRLRDPDKMQRAMEEHIGRTLEALKAIAPQTSAHGIPAPASALR
jgi:DNA-binding GntR family transcriptional regulator